MLPLSPCPWRDGNDETRPVVPGPVDLPLANPWDGTIIFLWGFSLARESHGVEKPGSCGSRRFMACCFECEALVDLDTDEVEEGEVVSCPECGMDLEVVTTNPLELRPTEEEDDFDEDEEKDDLLDEDYVE